MCTVDVQKIDRPVEESAKRILECSSKLKGACIGRLPNKPLSRAWPAWPGHPRFDVAAIPQRRRGWPGEARPRDLLLHGIAAAQPSLGHGERTSAGRDRTRWADTPAPPAATPSGR